MEILLLTANELLKSCGSPLKDSAGRDKLLAFSYSAAMKMLSKYTTVYNKLKLSIFDFIFFGGRSVSEITQGRYPDSSGEQLQKLRSCVFLEHICGGETFFLYPLSDTSGYKLLPPVRIGAELSGSTEGIEKIAKKIKKAASKKYILPFSYNAALKRQGEVQLKISTGIMRIKTNELAFVNRFNEEKFFRGINLETASEKIREFCDRHLLLNLSALYAMTFCGLSFRDIYTVDEVFGAFDRDIRSKDDIKGEAAVQLLKDIDRFNDEEMAETLIKMGNTLVGLPTPEADPNNAVTLAENYAAYCALSGIGESYLRVTEENPKTWLVLERDFSSEYKKIIGRAKLLSKYKSAKNLCEEIPLLCETGVKNFSAASGYKAAMTFYREIKLERT